MALVTHHQSAKVLQPAKQPFDFPASAVTPQGSSILRRGFRSVLSVRSDHLDPLLGQSFIQRVAVIGFIPDQPFRPCGGKGRSESLLDKGDFMRRSRCRVDGDRKTRAVGHRHELRTLAPLGLSHPEPPFFAITKVPSRKHSERSSWPRWRRSSAKASSTRRKVPSRTHRWNRRWQVWYGGNLSGRSFHLAPLRRTQRIPFRTPRLSFHGLPLPSGRRGRGGIKGSRIAHYSSVNSSRRAISYPPLPRILAQVSHL